MKLGPRLRGNDGSLDFRLRGNDGGLDDRLRGNGDRGKDVWNNEGSRPWLDTHTPSGAFTVPLALAEQL